MSNHDVLPIPESFQQPQSVMARLFILDEARPALEMTPDMRETRTAERANEAVMTETTTEPSEATMLKFERPPLTEVEALKAAQMYAQSGSNVRLLDDINDSTELAEAA